MCHFERGVEMETCFNYCDKEHGYFSSDERKFITKVRKLKEKYPEQVRIIAEPETNDGCIYAEMPTAWFTIRVPKQMNYTEEQKRVLSDRMKRIVMSGRVRERSLTK
jgi:hypothetical protein